MHRILNIRALFFKGDPYFVKYWNAVEENKEKHVMSGIQAGFEELKKGQTVLHALSAILRGANKADPKSVPPIKTFGAKKSTYFNMLFTENSPLVPVFMKAVTKTFETGQYDRIAVKWQGADIKGTVHKLHNTRRNPRFARVCS